MIRSILSTTGVKLISAFTGLLLLTINSRQVGAEGLGEIRVFTITVAILVILANLPGGPGLIFRASRHQLVRLIFPSYLWISMVCLVFYAAGFIDIFHLENHSYIALCTFLYALAWANVYLLLGREKIRLHNIIMLSFSLILIIGTIVGYYFFRIIDPLVYIRAYTFAAGGKFLIGFVFLLPELLSGLRSTEKSAFRVLLKDGLAVQGGNIVQQLNYRLGEYFLEAFWGKAILGIYSAAIMIGEGVWTAARSAALVQYARLSNMQNDVRARKITFLLAKIAVLITALGFGILLLLPVSFYTSLFGDEFTQLKSVLLYMSPSLVLFSAGFLYAHYFSGKGRFITNTIISSSAFVISLLGAFLFVKPYGLTGIIISQTLTYMTGLALMTYLLLRNKNRANRWFFPGKKDLRLLQFIWRNRKGR